MIFQPWRETINLSSAQAVNFLIALYTAPAAAICSTVLERWNTASKVPAAKLRLITVLK
jgi:hypothetical protein